MGSPKIIQARDAIERFTGDNAYLSNFYPSAIFLPAYGITVPSAEHAYQMAKTDREHAGRISMVATPAEAKKLGRNCPLVPEWEQNKRGVMLNVLLWKFMQNDDLRHRLATTGKLPLIEGNGWGDTYWGAVGHTQRGWENPELPWWTVGPGRSLAGHNWLGRLLMMVRETL
jgi:ribA/ribD-fused uncharacterized protein